MILQRGERPMYTFNNPPPGMTLEGYLTQLAEEGYGFDHLERTGQGTAGILRAHEEAGRKILILEAGFAERIIVATREKTA